MEIKTKKIIAREILFLAFCLITGMLAFLCIYLYNFYNQNRTTDIRKLVSVKNTIADSLSKPYKDKYIEQLQFTKIVFSEYTTDYVDSDFHNMNRNFWQVYYNLAKKDSIKYIWENVLDIKLTSAYKKYGLETPEKFQEYILKNHINKSDSEKYNLSSFEYERSKLLQTKMNLINESIITLESQTYLAFLVLGSIFFLLFPVRYFLYSITWSMKILKEDKKINGR